MRLASEPNYIFLITVDCLRADAVGCIGGTDLTPNINRLAKDSAIFTKAFANGPGTNQSFPAILTSTYFLMHGGMHLLPQYSTLAEVLSNNGFKTVAFHSNPFLSKNLGWGRGFSDFYDFMDVIKSPSAFITRQQDTGLAGKLVRFASKEVLGANRSARMQRLLKKIYYKFSRYQIPYLDGGELNKSIIRWIEKNVDKKFFLWMHYMDPHYPFVPPEPYLSDFSSRQETFVFNLSINYESPSRDEVETLRNLYLGEVRYVDECIGEFLQYLEKKELLEGSLILLMGDHGHAFMEHESFGHAYDVLYNEVIRVPLLVYGLGERQKVDVAVQLLDVPPTILDVLGIEKPPDFLGRSLLNTENDFTPIFSESAKPDLINLRYDVSKKIISAISDGWKLIINELRGSTELYNLKKDAQEKNNLVESESELFEELALLIREHLLHEKLGRSKMKHMDVEEEKIKERLRSLGYI